MCRMGIKRLGRDYTLTPEAKRGFLKEARFACRKSGVKFGAGDTEFIHMSDGFGCCNGSSFFLKNAMQFRANFTGVLAGNKQGARIFFSDVEQYWQPRLNVHQYLTTNSRGRIKGRAYSSWMSLLAYRWNGENGPYSPQFFHGVSWTGDYDNKGFKIYQINSDL